jgi:hypothetical protein
LPSFNAAYLAAGTKAATIAKVTVPFRAGVRSQFPMAAQIAAVTGGLMQTGMAPSTAAATAAGLATAYAANSTSAAGLQWSAMIDGYIASGCPDAQGALNPLCDVTGFVENGCGGDCKDDRFITLVSPMVAVVRSQFPMASQIAAVTGGLMQIGMPQGTAAATATGLATAYAANSTSAAGVRWSAMIDGYIASGCPDGTGALNPLCAPVFQFAANPMGQTPYMARPKFMDSTDAVIKETISKKCNMWDGGQLFPAVLKGFTLSGKKTFSTEDTAIWDTTGNSGLINHVPGLESVYKIDSSQTVADRLNRVGCSTCFARKRGPVPFTVTEQEAVDIMQGVLQSIRVAGTRLKDKCLDGVNCDGKRSWTKGNSHSVIDSTASFNKTLKEQATPPVNLLIAGLFIMLAYAGVVKGLTGLAGAVLVALGALGGLGMANAMGYDFSFTSITVLPFLLVAIGVDDMFVLLSDFDSADTDTPVEELVADCYHRVGGSITLTTCTNVFAFFVVSAMIPLGVIQDFAGAAAVSLVFVFFQVFFIFPAVMALSHGRKCTPWSSKGDVAVTQAVYTKGLGGVPGKIVFLALCVIFTGSALGGITKAETGLTPSEVLKETTVVSQFWIWRFENFDFWPAYSYQREVDFTIPLNQLKSVALYERVVRQQHACACGNDQSWIQDFTRWTMPGDLQTALYANNKCSATNPATSGVCGAATGVAGLTCGVTVQRMPAGVDLDVLRTGGEVTDAAGNARVHPRSKIATKYPMCFDASYLSTTAATAATFAPQIAEGGVWCAQFTPTDRDGDRGTDHFSQCLFNYLKKDLGSGLLSPKIQTNKNDTAVQMPISHSNTFDYYLTGLQTNKDFVDVITETRVEYDSDLSIKAYPRGQVYSYWDQYLKIDTRVYKTVGYSCLVAFFTTVLLLASTITSQTENTFAQSLLPSVVGAFQLILIIMLTVAEIYGFMGWANIKLNAFSILSLVMSVGLAVESTAHTVMAFIKAGGTRNERAAEAMRLMFMPITNGAISTFLGIVMLAGSTQFFFDYFFMLYTIIVIAGVVNGLVLVPLVLSVMGPAELPHHHSPAASVAGASASAKEIQLAPVKAAVVVTSTV